MHKIDVHVDQPYSVSVGHGVVRTWTPSQQRIAVLYDSNLPQALVDPIMSQVELAIPLPSGEACKTLTVFASVLSQLAERAFPRDCAIVAMGGGATSDLAGYVAASYLRGVAFYNMPTSLLGMVDASVGGKTGVNLPEGKNLVGAFWQPQAVYADLDYLRSLPAATFKEGMAEMFKHGLIEKPALPRHFYELSDIDRPEFAQDLARSIAVKAGVVSRDPTEKGERAHLNLGHTLGHAIEGVSKHAIAHGEAVAYGLHYAAYLSALEGGEDVTALTREFLHWMQPKTLPTWSWPALQAYMARDKKADSQGLRFTLLKTLGECYVARVSAEQQAKAFDLWVNDLP